MMTWRQWVRGIAIVAVAISTAVAALAAEGLLPNGRLLAEILYDAPLYIAAALGLWCTSRAVGSERRFWGLLSTATLLLCITETYWSYYVLRIDPHGPQLPHWIQLLQAVAAMSFVGMIVSLTEWGNEPGVTRWRVYVDIAAGAVVLYAIVFSTYTQVWVTPEVAGFNDSIEIISAIYPVLGIVVAFSILVVFWRWHGWRAWEALICGATFVWAAGLMTWPSWYASYLVHPENSGTFVALGTAGWGLIVLGEVFRLTEAGVRRPLSLRRLPDIGGAWLSSAYTIALGVAVVAMFAYAPRMSSADDTRVVQLCGILVAVLLASRSMLMSVERVVDRQRAAVDAVTGLPLMTGMRDFVGVVFEQLRGTGKTLAIGVVVVEELKRINVAFGHTTGDRVLAEVGGALVESVGQKGRVFRAEERTFVAVLPKTDADDARAILSRAATLIKKSVFAGGIPVSISVGIEAGAPESMDFDAMLDHANAAVRRALASTSIDVVVYDPDVPSPADPKAAVAAARKRAHVSAVRGLAVALDERSSQTGGHGQAVADLSRRLGDVLGLDEARLAKLELAALIHDVGKVGVPDAVLGKKESLTRSELAEMHEHAKLGERIIAAAGMPDIASWVRSHHERWDGAGYPDGLAGEDIPLESRILAITSSFEAMTSTRSWKSPVHVEEAIAEIENCAGSQFDPRLADVFVRLVRGMQGAPAPTTLERLGTQPT